MAQIILPTRQPTEQKVREETAMDRLLKGLQVAGNVFGIASDISNLRTQSQARDIAEAREGREQAKFGIETQRQTMLAPPEQPGTSITLQTPEGDEVTQLRVPRPPTPDESKKLRQELLTLQVQQAKKNLNKQPGEDKQINISPEDERYWVEERGVNPALVSMVKRGFGGRNPTSTLNSAAERDEPTTAEVNVITGLDQTEKFLGESLATLNPDVVGPTRGRIPDIPFVGKYIPEGQEAAWRAKIGRMNDAYRQAVTGMGASQKEIETLMSRIPGPSDTPEQFIAKAKDFRKEIEQRRDIYLDNLARSGKFVKPFRNPGAAIVYQQEKMRNPNVNPNPVTFAPGVKFPSIIPEAQAQQPFDPDAYVRGQ